MPEDLELSFKDAVAELDALIAELESDRVDFDALAGKVARAAELLAFCRSRVDAARATIKEISLS
jgi:exodeoxyribonuclease VII small subunit